MHETPSTYKYPIEKIPDIKLLILYVAEQARSACKKDKISRQWLSDFIAENISESQRFPNREHTNITKIDLLAEQFLRSNIAHMIPVPPVEKASTYVKTSIVPTACRQL